MVHELDYASDSSLKEAMRDALYGVKADVRQRMKKDGFSDAMADLICRRMDTFIIWNPHRD